MNNKNLKNKPKNLQEKQSFIDETKQVRNLMAEGKQLYEKGFYVDASKLFSTAISKSSSAQILHLNHIFHLRGLCEFKQKNYQRAERDFNEAISISDQKSKIQFFISLGKCKVQQASSPQKDSSPTSVNIHLQQAIKCFQKPLIQTSTANQHQKGDANFNIGLIYRKQKKNHLAIKYFGEAIKCFRYPEEQYQVYLEKGICYREIKEIENSINDFLKALQIKKGESFPNFHLGVNYMMVGNYQSALQKLSAAIEFDKTQPQFRNYKGLALYLSGQYEQCLLVFEQALILYIEKNKRNSEVAECMYNKGNALINLQRYDEALMAFKNAQQLQIDEQLEIKLLYAEGRTYEMMNNPQSIVKFKDCLRRQKPANDLYLATLHHLGKCQSLYNYLSESIQTFTLILSHQCHDQCVYEQRGKVYLKNQQYSFALKDFQHVVSMNEKYSDIYYYLGMSKIYLNGEGLIEQGLKDLFKAIELGAKMITTIYNGISCAYLQCKKYQKALIYSNLALVANPTSEQSLIQRSLIYLELEQYKKSIEDLTTALQTNNLNPIIYYRRGLAYYKNKQFLHSIEDLQKALKLNPINKSIQADIYYHIGISQSNLEKYQEAIDPLTQAIGLIGQIGNGVGINNNKAKYYHQRAKCQILIDENLPALNDLNEVIKCQPNNAFAYFRRGFAHKALRMYEQAADDFLKARQLKPDDPRLIINKKQIYQTKYRKLNEAGEED